MNLVTTYLANAKQFLDYDYPIGAMDCLERIFDIVKVHGFESEEQYELFLTLFDEVRQVV